MNLTAFAESRNVKTNTISNYIARNREMFEGHLIKNGHLTELDEVALEILEKMYPLPDPVQVINGIPQETHIETLNELNQARQKIEERDEIIFKLQQELNRTKSKLVETESGIKLLENTAQLKEEFHQKEIVQIQKEVEQQKAEVDRLKNRSLIDRILNK